MASKKSSTSVTESIDEPITKNIKVDTPKEQISDSQSPNENKEKYTDNKNDNNNYETENIFKKGYIEDSDNKSTLFNKVESSNKPKNTKKDKESHKLTRKHFDHSLKEHTSIINTYLNNLSSDITNINSSIKKLSIKIDYIEKRLQEYEKNIEYAELNIDEFIEIFGKSHKTKSLNINEAILEKVLEHNNERGLISSKNKSAAVNTALLLALYKSKYEK